MKLCRARLLTFSMSAIRWYLAHLPALVFIMYGISTSYAQENNESFPVTYAKEVGATTSTTDVQEIIPSASPPVLTSPEPSDTPGEKPFKMLDKLKPQEENKEDYDFGNEVPLPDGDSRSRINMSDMKYDNPGRAFVDSSPPLKTSTAAITSTTSEPRTNSYAPGESVPRFRNLSDEEVLLEKLFTDYNPSARPVMNSSKTVDVEIQFSLMHIKDLDVRSQVLTTTGLLILEWTDERLTWNPEEHNNMTEIITEAKGIWRPEFAVINGAENIYQDYNEFRAVVTHEGIVHWEPGGVFKTMCEIDITYYPFDEQHCALLFGAWSYHTSKMNLTNSSKSINSDSYKTNGEWEIYNTEAKRNEFFYECCPNEKFANVAFVVFMRRRHTFYILNVILPSIMTSVLLLSVFFCTPGQKVQIGVVVLLSFRIFLLNVAGNIPKTSDHIPLLGIYLTCTMAITTLSMVLTVFVLNLHYVSDRPVPRWARRIVFFYIAPMMGMCSIAESMRVQQRAKKSRANSFYHRKPSAVNIDAEGDETTAIIEMHNRTAQQQNHNNEHKAPEPEPEVQKNIFTYSERPREDDKPPDYSKDWKRMAEVFDRLFFWLFLLAISISTLVLFHPLTKHYTSGEHMVEKEQK